MDASLIQLITDLVVAELGSGSPSGGIGPGVNPGTSGSAIFSPVVQPSCNGPIPPGRKVLVCATPAPVDGLVATWEALKAVENITWVVVPGCNRSESPAVNLSPLYTRAAPAVWDELVSQVEAVVLPALTLEVLSKSSLLIPDVPAVAACLQALSSGVPVYASSFEVEKLKRSTGRMPGGFQTAYFGHLRTVESLGFQVLEASQIAQRLGGKAKVLATAARGRDVLTVEDVEAFARSGSKVLRVAPGTIVTPLARDVAQSMGIEVSWT